MFSTVEVMCGIFAICGDQPIQDSAIQAGLSVMNHRGPDGSDYVFSTKKHSALGHCRLMVRGSGNDTQPIWNEDRSIAVSVNGEFYDDHELRLGLEAKGHQFRTTSDSEIVLHLYEEYGYDCLEFLRGEFALVLWDENRQQVFAARDRFGIKPLCYAVTENGLVISSEAKAIFASGMLRADWDQKSLQHVLAHQYLPSDRSLFCNVRMLPPAHFLTFQSGKEPTVKRYWQPSFEEKAVSRKEVLAGLIESVKLRLQSNLAPAFSLSGGIDSSAVVALANQLTNGSVPAFCVSFNDGDFYNEIDLVNDTANELGVDLTTVEVGRQAMVEDLSDAVFFSEGFCINSQLVGKYRLSRAIRESGHNVVLSGEGADEVFLGYAHLQVDAGHNLAAEQGRTQSGLMLPNQSLDIEMTPPKGFAKWPSFLRAKIGFFKHYRPFLSDAFAAEFCRRQCLDELTTILNRGIPSNIPEVKQSSWLWTRTALSSYILKTLADGTEMAHSVEGRVPFLDHHFFEKVFAAPISQNLRDGGAKQLLRDSLKDRLPEKIRTRPKLPFIAPPLLMEPSLPLVKEFIFDTIRSENFDSNPCFDQDRTLNWIEKLATADQQAKLSADPALMTVLSIAMLQQRFHL